MPRTAGRRSFGSIEKRPGGKFRVSFYGPDGLRHRRPSGYVSTRGTAEAWLGQEQSRIAAAELPGAEPWVSPAERAAATERAKARRDGSATLRVYVESSAYLDRRNVQGQPLKPRTRQEYERLLERSIYPTLGSVPMGTLRAGDVETWYYGPAFHRVDGTTLSTTRARAYDLLRAILRDAVNRGVIDSSPATIKGGGEASRQREPVALTLAQVAAIADAMPAHLRAAVYVAARCGLRQGELFALRSQDIETRDDGAMVIHVRRNVTRVRGRVVVGTPKTVAGHRSVPVPKTVAPILRQHLEDHTAPGPTGLVFPPRATTADEKGDHVRYMAPASLYGRAGTDEKPGRGFYEARRVAGLDDLTWHDLRHTFATLMARVPGMSLPALQYLGGWTTPAMVMRYAHHTQDSGQAFADAVDSVT